MPLWPTFGIDLEAKLPGYDNMIYLPQKCADGSADRWTRFDTAAQPASRLGGFLSSIVGTMQNWNDNTQSRVPGYRDRIVTIYLHKNEGGLNLDMPYDVLMALKQRGAAAGQLLVERFSAPSDLGAGRDERESRRRCRRTVEAVTDGL